MVCSHPYHSDLCLIHPLFLQSTSTESLCVTRPCTNDVWGEPSRRTAYVNIHCSRVCRLSCWVGACRRRNRFHLSPEDHHLTSVRSVSKQFVNTRGPMVVPRVTAASVLPTPIFSKTCFVFSSLRVFISRMLDVVAFTAHPSGKEIIFRYALACDGNVSSSMMGTTMFLILRLPWTRHYMNSSVQMC